MSFLSLSHLLSLCVAQEEEIHSSLVQEHGGGGVSSTSFTVTMDMQPLYNYAVCIDTILVELLVNRAENPYVHKDHLKMRSIQ